MFVTEERLNRVAIAFLSLYVQVLAILGILVTSGCHLTRSSGFTAQSEHSKQIPADKIELQMIGLTSTRSEAKLQTENHGSTESYKPDDSSGVTEFLDPPSDIVRELNLELADFEAHVDEQLQSSELDPTLVEQNYKSIADRLWGDQLNFYSPESITLLGGGLLAGAMAANTSLDETIQRHFQSSVRGATSDEWFESLHTSKELGNGKYTLPVFATAWAAAELLPDNAVLSKGGKWGERSIRGFIVGAPPLIVFQQFTGGSRPSETNESAEWHPFRDNNGISGHAFMGALPFITAAKMSDDLRVKLFFYAGSALTPLSRVNDNAHYPSQVALGWWMAYLAASAIDSTDNPNAKWKFYPYSTSNGSGILAEYRF